MESLQGKNAIVTGAGKGLGKAISIALAQEGVNVALIGRTEKDLISVADELKTYNVKTVIAIADVSDIDAVNLAVAKVKAELGAIDILINNAGVGHYSAYTETTEADFDKMVNIHLKAPYFLTQKLFTLPNLLAPHSIIQSFFSQQVFVTPGFYNFSFFQYKNPVGVHNGA